MNPLAEARRILAAPAAHMILSNPEWRELVAGLVAIIEGDTAYQRSVNEALNTGDGSYRP